MSAALTLSGVRLRYRHGLMGAAAGRPALDGVDLRLEEGETLALVGESGSGKSSLVRAALGLRRPDEGEVRVLGRDPYALSSRQLQALRREVQALFQDPEAHLDPHLRVRQLLLQTLRIHRPGEAPGPLLDEALHQVGLAHRADAHALSLSGGEQRRVGIARVLLCRPRLLLADEPTAGLDGALAPALLQLIVGAPRAERATLLVSHDLPLVAAVATRIVVLQAGRVVEELPAGLLGRGPHHPLTWSLLVASGAFGLGEVPCLPPPERPMPARGCAAADRCPLAQARCKEQVPPLRERTGGHRLACPPQLDAEAMGCSSR